MRIALGSVQFGLDYGVSNPHGRTRLEEVAAILEFARGHGIDTLDTAAAYGEAEAVLAKLEVQRLGFRVISKTLRLSHGLPAVMARAEQSVAQLGAPLEGLLVHSAADLALPEGPALWDALRGMKAAGLVRKIGISAYASDPILELANGFRPDLMQVPVGLVDQRLQQNGVLAALSAMGVEIHARSLFHQGLIFANPAALPPKLATSRAAIEALQTRIAASGPEPLALALAFARSVPAIDMAVLGVTRADELRAIVEAANLPVPQIDFSQFAQNDALILDPTRW